MGAWYSQHPHGKSDLCQARLFDDHHAPLGCGAEPPPGCGLWALVRQLWGEARPQCAQGQHACTARGMHPVGERQMRVTWCSTGF